MNIGKIAELLNVSPQTVRYYEENGIISPGRTGDGKYREYTDEDLMLLWDCHFFRSTGLSIKEIREVLGQSSVQRSARVMEEKESELRKQALWNIASADHLRTIHEVLMTIEFNLNRGEYIVWPEHLQLDCLAEGEHFSDIDANDELINSWMRAAPFVYMMKQHALSDIKQMNDDCTGRISYIATPQNVKAAGMLINDRVKTIPRQLCVSVFIESERPFAIDAQQLDYAFTLIEKNDHCISGQIVQLLMMAREKNGGYSRYYRVLIPVSKNKIS